MEMELLQKQLQAEQEVDAVSPVSKLLKESVSLVGQQALAESMGRPL